MREKGQGKARESSERAELKKYYVAKSLLSIRPHHPSQNLSTLHVMFTAAALHRSSIIQQQQACLTLDWDAL